MVSVDCDKVFKVLLLGDSSVGKTCLLLRYTEDIFAENKMSTIGVDYKLKLINSSENEVIKLQIWDTAGQDRFRTITKNYYRGSNGVMLVYDITSKISFINTKNWLMQMKDYFGDDASVVLVGHKSDLDSQREISQEKAMKLARDNNFGFYEASAKENINITEAFEYLTKEMIKKNLGKDNAERRKSFKVVKKIQNNTNKKKKQKCC